MKAKILNIVDEYLPSNPLFCRGGSKWQFSAKIQSQIKGVKMALERWPHYTVTSIQRLVGLLVKSVHFSYLCCIMCQW